MDLGDTALADTDFAGEVHVVDADTLRIADRKVRLFGIDAPEIGQTCELADGRPWGCGRWAADRVRALYDGAFAQCRSRGHDRYGRS